MSFKIRLTPKTTKKTRVKTTKAVDVQRATQRKSVVQVYFADRHITLAYYNDRFDLHRGDMVYVEGKLEGMLGRITEVNYNFKIKMSDYKRVIAVADTEVHGKFFMAGSNLLTFDRKAIPSKKVKTWFMSPDKVDDEYACGNDGTTFRLDNLENVKVTPVVAERGQEYFDDNRVKYISLKGKKGYAIIEGSEAYEVEFEYNNGEISRLVCSCYCSYNCKHEYAAMLQLRQILEVIEKDHAEEYERTGFFAAVNKDTLFSFAIDGKEEGSITL